MTLSYATFAVDDRPMCVWTGDPDRPDRDFLDAVDSEYFSFIGKRLWRLARTRHKGRAALALRASYHHAIETLVALLFAALQAPHCAVGWMHAYRVRDLRSLIRKLDLSERFPSIFNKRRGNWAEASQAIFQFMSLDDSNKRERIVARFGTLWSRLARELTSEEAIADYNSIKHGLRIRSGGFTLMAGSEKTAGVAAAPEDMRTIGSSETGSSHWTLRRIGTHDAHFHCVQRSLNWDVTNLAAAMCLVSTSVKNIVAFLRCYNGSDPTTQEFSWPTDDSFFDEPWKRYSGVSSSSFAIPVTEDMIKVWSHADILNMYAENRTMGWRRQHPEEPPTPETAGTAEGPPTNDPSGLA